MLIRRVFADNRLIGSGVYSDALVIELGTVYCIKFSGIAAVDSTTATVVGYEPHNGAFAPDALEQQVADIFRQAECLMQSISREIGKPVTFLDMTEALVFLREDYPLVIKRFNDAYIDEFKKRGIGEYPTRTTAMKTVLPNPNALVEIRFEAMVKA